MRLIDYFDKGARAFPQRVAVTYEGRDWSYEAFRGLTCRAARALDAVGLRPHSHVSICAPNHPFGLAAQYGAIRAGHVWMPVNARNSAIENVAVLRDLGADWLFFHSQFEDEVSRIRAAVPTIRGFVCLDRALPGAPSFDEWCGGHAADHLDLAGSMDDVPVMLTTSGTTGRPKGVRLSNRSWEMVIASYQTAMPHDEPPRQLVVTPLTHQTGTFTTTMWSIGSTQVILPRTDPLSIMEAIEKFRITTVFLPPTLIYTMLSHPEVRRFDYSSLRYMMYGAAPMSVAKLNEALDVFGPVLVQGFGQSECPIMSFLSVQDHVRALAEPTLRRRLQSAGRAGPYTCLAIMDDEGRLLPAEQRGEIVVRSTLVMQGYHQDAAATAAVSGHGWHHTGDVGYLDADGYLYIVDRKRDLIISGGFNIFPTEVEQVVMAHAAGNECAVVGVPHEKWGEAVLAVVELRKGAAVTAEELLDWCRERLGGVKAPKSLEFTDSLPRTATGKVLRREIRARHWAGRERAI